jgi:hypothetical protein
VCSSDLIKVLPNGKTPGVDGIGIEFYKVFWTDIEDLVFDSLKYAIDTGKLSIDQRRSILSLIPKKDKDITNLKNWRPLTLLNSDYKILAKTLATRLNKVIDDIISQDKTGCIKGRSAFANIRSSIDIINYAKEQQLHGLIAMIDYEKAFDTVKWPFLFKCLDKLNFGQHFIKCIKCMYNENTTSIINNGFLSEPFYPKRGIKQGCPASASIFFMIVEFLANAIKQNPRLRGIKIGNIKFKSVNLQMIRVYIWKMEIASNCFQYLGPIHQMFWFKSQ